MNTISRRLVDAQLLVAAHVTGLVQRLRDDERGQASAEYAGVVFVAVTIVLALITAAAQWGTDLTTAVSNQIAKITAHG